MRAQLIIQVLTLAVLLVVAGAEAQESNVITAPFELRQDFEDGHISGWESYPPFQDSAFDPGFKCSNEDNRPGSRYALSRRVQIDFPTQTEIGFIRKVRLQMAEGSSVSFTYLLRMFSGATRMEAVLCGKNGNRYICTISSPAEGRWQRVTVPASSFTNGGVPVSQGEEIEAFYVLVCIDRTNPDVAYRFLLDDVVVTGAAPVQLRILEPNCTVLEHWNRTVLHKHYSAGGTLGLTVSLRRPTVLTSVTFSLSSPRGTMVCDGVPLRYRRERDVWEHSALYTFSVKDEKGRWRGMLEGKDGQGRKVKTPFDVWVTDTSEQHPRMYFGADNMDFYRRRMDGPKWRRWFDTLAAQTVLARTTSNVGSIVFGAETSSLRAVPSSQWTLKSLAQVDVGVFDSTYLLPTLSRYYGIMVPAMEILYNNALLYSFRSDREAGAYAKDALVAIAGWKSWTHPWFLARHQESYYPVGELGVRAAFCYDAVGPLMSPDERKAVREGLLRNCIVPVYMEYVVENRIPSSTSNWIANSVSGAISCILALYGDDPEHGSYEPYLSGLLTKLEDHIQSTLDTSGAWGEGVGYQSFAYTNLLPTITALGRVLHCDITTPALLRSYLYFLYNNSGSEIFDVGDSHASPTSLSYFAWILTKTDDPVFRWLYRTAPREHSLDFLFGREEGAATPPDALPKSKLFPDIGAAQFRSGWTGDDCVLNFRCGAFVNHQHFHQGSFQLGAFGEALVPEAGVVHYYDDPWYQPYYVQAAGHNTVLLDRNPGSQRSGDYLHFVKGTDDRAEMREFIGTEYYGAATGELHKIYRGNLQLFERNIVFMRPDYFIVFDRLRSSGQAHEYNWLLHFDDKENVKISGSEITIKRRKATLLAKVLSPEHAVTEMKGAPVRLGVPITRPGYLQVSNASKSMGENFLVVLHPVRTNPAEGNTPGAGWQERLDGLTHLKGANYEGARIARGDSDDEILFRIEESKEKIQNNYVSTDGRIVAYTVRGDRVILLAVHDAASLTYNPGRQTALCTGLAGTTRFSAAGSFGDDTAEWNIRADGVGEIGFRSPTKPSEVNVGGRAVPSFSWDEANRLLRVPVVQGTNTITVRF